jgi:hypothetical protein
MYRLGSDCDFKRVVEDIMLNSLGILALSDFPHSGTDTAISSQLWLVAESGSSPSLEQDKSLTVALGRIAWLLQAPFIVDTRLLSGTGPGSAVFKLSFDVFYGCEDRLVQPVA